MIKIPRKLQAAFKKAGGQRALARAIGVNPKYINDLFKDGIEPNDTTGKLRDIRKRMFLPKYRRDPARARPNPAQLPGWLRRRKKAIAKLAKDTRKAINERA